MNVCVVASKVLAAPEEQDNATTGTKETWTTSHHPENQTPSSCTELTGTSTSDKSSQTSEFNYLFKESKMQSFTQEYFSNRHDSDDKVRFYTGLPSFDTLNTVFNFVEAHVSRRTKILTPFQEFVMVLMKLRLNVPQQDLAYRFDVSQPTVSRIFWSWMIVMDARLSPLLKWPEREEIIRTMPACFGDLVMADRGFTIQESLALRQVKLAIPTFTRGSKQLDPVDIEHTRGIANVRVHVERVIGQLKQKVKMLQETLEIDYVSLTGGSTEPMVDRIIRVCAVLTNMCPSVVPLT